MLTHSQEYLMSVPIKVDVVAETVEGAELLQVRLMAPNGDTILIEFTDGDDLVNFTEVNPEMTKSKGSALTFNRLREIARKG